jgi:hypothetical protein
MHGPLNVKCSHTVLSTARTTTAQTEKSCINCTVIRQIAPPRVQQTVPFHEERGTKKKFQHRDWDPTEVLTLNLLKMPEGLARQ